MRVLILGGTRFVGRAAMEVCVARGDRVTLFHRGLSAPERFEGVEHVLGDRNQGLGALADREWDLVVDPSGFEVLAPGDPEAPVQIVDARDLARWMVTTDATGTFNATGTPAPMRVLFDAMREATGSDARFTWVPDEILLRHAIAPYSELPFWLPASLGAKPAPNDRARAAGLALRPMLDTVRDTWSWLGTSWDAEVSARAHRRIPIPAGISAALERRLLDEARRR